MLYSDHFEVNGFSAAELYTSRFGFYSLFPLDMLHTVAHDPEVVKAFKTYHVLNVDFGLEKVIFAASPKYRNKEERFDDVVVDLGGRADNYCAKLLMFFGGVAWKHVLFLFDPIRRF